MGLCTTMMLGRKIDMCNEEAFVDLLYINWNNSFTGPQCMAQQTLLHIVPFCEGPNKKLEGFAKQKQPAIFAMRHASQVVQHHPSLIYNVPYFIATLLRHIPQTKPCDPLGFRPP
jgi:hypothetical protein